jgi:hypothetical protein
MHLYQVKMSKAVAGAIVSEDGRIVRCADIIAVFMGQHINNLRRWVRIKGGDLSYLGRCK